MKKISTLLMMLFAFVGAVSAQTFVEPVTGGFYKLKGDNADKPWLTNQLNGSSIVVSANESEAAVYLKTANGLMDIATGKYIGMSGSVVSLVNNETAITIGDHKNGDKYSVKVSNNYMYNNNTDGKTHESSDWITNIERFWGFVEVTEWEYTIKTSTGSFDGSGSYHSVWKYTRTLTTPAELTLTSDANNMNSNNGFIQLHSGKSESSNYTLRVPAGYTIISYSFDYAFGNSDTKEKKFIVGEQEYNVTAANQTLTVENINAETAQFTLSGENQPVKLSNFIVKIQYSNTIAQMKEGMIAEVESNSGKLKDALGYYSYTVNGEKVYNADDVKTTVNTTESVADLFTINYSFALNTPEVGKYYRIKAHVSGKYLDAVNRHSGNQMGMKTEAERDFLGSIFLLDEGNRLKNLGTETYIKDTYNIGATQAQANTWTFEASPRTLGCLLVKSSSSSPYLHDSGFANRCSSEGGHAAHDFVLEEVVLVNYILTDNAGNTYTAENVEGTIDVDPVFTGIPVATLPDDPNEKPEAKDGYILEYGSWNGNTFTATITFPFIVSSASQSNPMLIRQNFNVDEKMWTAVGEKVNAVDGIPSLGASQWMIYPSLNGTEFTFKIKSVSTEKYVTATTTEGVTLTTDGTNFKCGRTTADSKSAFVWTCTNGDETLYVTLGSNDDNTPLNVTTDVATAGVNAFVAFQDFIDFKVTIGEAGYTTVYAPFTVMMPYEQNMGKTVDIYAITDGKVVNDKVQLTQMSWYIPGEQAAILKGEPGTYVFAVTDYDLDAETDAVWEKNLLKGSSVNTYVAGDAYVLGVIDEEVGLYKAELNKNANGEAGTTHFLNNAGKAYLPASAIASTQGVLRFNFGGNTTAIESVLNNGADANAPIYDLSGRRVMNTVKGGIYIQNGKKFIVK